MDVYADNPMRCPSPATSPATTGAPSSPRSSSERERGSPRTWSPAAPSPANRRAETWITRPRWRHTWTSGWLGQGHRPRSDGHDVPRGPGRPRTVGVPLPGLGLEPSRRQPDHEQARSA